MKIKFFFAWYDFWIGFFYNKNERTLYFIPFPMCVFKIQLKKIEDYLKFITPFEGFFYAISSNHSIVCIIQRDNHSKLWLVFIGAPYCKNDFNSFEDIRSAKYFCQEHFKDVMEKS